MVLDTSLIAYFNRVLPYLSDKQAQVYEVFRDGLDHTNDEVAHILGWGINRVTPRVLELRELGILKDNGVRLNSHGNNAHCWVAESNPLFDVKDANTLVQKKYLGKEQWDKLHRRMVKAGYEYMGNSVWGRIGR